MNLKFIKATVVSLVLFVSSFANAGLITADVTIDLDTALTGNSWTGSAFALDNIVDVASGDTVTINIDFEGDQVLQWNSNGNFQPWLMLTGYPNALTNPSHSGGFSWSGLSVSFDDLIQGTALNIIGPSGGSGSIHLGPTNAFAADGVIRQFRGVSLTFDTTWTDGDLTRQFSTIGYGIPLFGGTVSYSEISKVPEPSTLAIFALGMIGLASRRFKKQS